MVSWKEEVNKGNFPLCSEVCKDCRDGIHVFHILDQLSDLYGKWTTKEVFGSAGRKEYKIITLHGRAEDELWLELLMKSIARIYEDVKNEV